MRTIKNEDNVDHPNLVKIEECFQNDRYLFLTTEFLTGPDLFTRFFIKFEEEEDYIQNFEIDVAK